MTRTHADGVIGLALLGAVVALALALTHCSLDKPNGAASAPSEAWPCGRIDQVCDVMPRWQDDTCCGPNDACPGPHAGDAPPGFCEDAADMDPQYSARRVDAGAPVSRPRTMHKIRKAVP
jgi:hypothetical protein